MTCGAISFIIPALLWSSALLNHLAVPKGKQPKDKQQSQRKLFSLRWEARKDIGLEAEAFGSYLWLYYNIPKYFTY